MYLLKLMRDEILLEDLEDVFNFCYFFLRICGLVPGKENGWLCLFTATFAIYHNLLLLADAIYFKIIGNHTDEFLNALTQFMGFTPLSTYFINNWYFRKELKNITDEIKSDFKTDRYPDQSMHRFVVDFNKKAYYLNISVFVCVATHVVVLYIQPPVEYLIASYTSSEPISFEYALPYSMYAYVNVNNYLLYSLIYLAQGGVMIYVVVSCCGITNIMIICILHTASQFRVFNYKLINYLDDSCFRDMVKEHQRLIRLTDAVVQSFTGVLFVNLLAASVRLCLCLYIMLMNSDQLMYIFSFLFYELATLLYLMVDCSLGEILLKESSQLHGSFYGSNWEKLSIQNRKNLIFCNTKTLKESNLRAANFFVLRLNLATQVLKTTFGYFSLLRKTMMK